MFDWSTSIVTDENEQTAIRCRCGKDILGQIGNGTILCGPKLICDSLCMRDCIALCHEETAGSYDTCVFQSVSELITVFIHGIPCNAICENTRARIVTATVAISALLTIVIACIIISCKLKSKTKR